MEYAIEAEGLVKRLGNTLALDGIDFSVRRGSVLGMLGPNGAGKTTAVRILATLLAPDAGGARVADYDVVSQAAEVRRLVGLTGQYASVDEALTGRQNLVMIGLLLDLSGRDATARATELLEWFDLTTAADRPARTYSGGMRRRLDLAASWSGGLRWCFSTSPPPALTRPSARTCGGSSGRWCETAPPCEGLGNDWRNSPTTHRVPSMAKSRFGASARDVLSRPGISAVSNAWTAAGFAVAALTALVGGVTHMPIVWKVLFVTFTFCALLSVALMAARAWLSKPHLRAAVNQVRAELLSISETLQAIADLPCGQAVARLPLPAASWGPPNQDVLARELPAPLYNEVRATYESAHQVSSDCWRRATQAPNDPATVRMAQSERVAKLLDAIPRIAGTLYALVLGLETGRGPTRSSGDSPRGALRGEATGETGEDRQVGMQLDSPDPSHAEGE